MVIDLTLYIVKETGEIMHSKEANDYIQKNKQNFFDVFCTIEQFKEDIKNTLNELP